ncbi:MAG: chemotaxis protein CheC [Methanomassiliicoccales archaeon]|nr:MAG: chemotaxis protein CheC [Methanomassiliicoccales archaeon]
MTDDDGGLAFTEMQLDALKELGNIGASHASAALTTMIKRDVIIDVPDCFVCAVERLKDMFHDEYGRYVGAYFDTVGEKKGHVLIVFPEDVSVMLTGMVMGDGPQGGRPFTDEDREMAAEIGNILVSAYLSSISDFTGIMLLPSPPLMSVGPLSEVLAEPVRIVSESFKNVVVVKTVFKYEGNTFPGYISYIPDVATRSALMTKFGIE